MDERKALNKNSVCVWLCHRCSVPTQQSAVFALKPEEPVYYCIIGFKLIMANRRSCAFLWCGSVHLTALSMSEECRYLPRAINNLLPRVQRCPRTICIITWNHIVLRGWLKLPPPPRLCCVSGSCCVKHGGLQREHPHVWTSLLPPRLFTSTDVYKQLLRCCASPRLQVGGLFACSFFFFIKRTKVAGKASAAQAGLKPQPGSTNKRWQITAWFPGLFRPPTPHFIPF